jgi:hypothetical protein
MPVSRRYQLGVDQSAVHSSVPERALRRRRAIRWRALPVAALPVAALLALGGMPGVASASPEPPEFGRCVKVVVGTGSYENGGCTKAGGSGRYEWLPGVVKTGFLTSKKQGTISVGHTAGGRQMTCPGESGSGQYSGLRNVSNVVFRVTGCETAGLKCQSTGAAVGEVVTSELDGELGIIKKSSEGPIKDKIGLDLFPPGHAGAWVEFTCAGLHTVVTGSVIVPVAARAMKSTATLKYAERSGKQKPEAFEGLEKDVLSVSIEGASSEQGGFSATLLQTNEEKVEINPVV